MMKIAIVLITSTMLVACAEGDLPDTQQVQQASVAPMQPQTETAPAALALNSSMSQIAIKQTTSFVASGGVAPYTYALVGTSAGTLSNNVYAAAIVGESVRVRVTDAKGTVAEASISVSWPALRDIFRGKNGNGFHYYTNNSNDGVFASFTSQGVGYRLLQDPIDDQTKPLYRCYVASIGSYFSSDKQNCENIPQYPNAYQNQGIMGYLYKTQRPGLVPVQRFAGGYDHVDSIKGSADADVSGYTPEGVAGYALAPLP